MNRPLTLPIRPALLLPPLLSQKDAWVWGQGGFVVDFRQGTLGLAGRRPSITRATTGSIVNASKILQQAASGAARFTFDPKTGAPRGVRIESQRTNKVTTSVNSTVMLVSGGTAEEEENFAVGPDGQQTMMRWRRTGSFPYLYFEATGIGTSEICSGSLILNKTSQSVLYILKVWFLNGGTQLSADFRFNTNTGLQNGADPSGNLNYGIEDWGDFWRAYLTLPNNGTGNTRCRLALQADALNQDHLIGHYQLETGDKPSSIMPTAGGTFTRNADDITLTGIVGLGITPRATDFVTFRLDSVYGTQPVLQYDDGSDNNRVALIVSSGTLYAKCTVSGSDVANINLGSVTAGTTYTAAFSRAKDDFKAAVNNGAVGTDTSGDIPAGLVNLRYGSDFAGNKLHGTIAQHGYLPFPVGGGQVKGLSVA